MAHAHRRLVTWRREPVCLCKPSHLSWRKIKPLNPNQTFHLRSMGGSQSVEIPGGGSEGYHVLRVSFWIYLPLKLASSLASVEHSTLRIWIWGRRCHLWPQRGCIELCIHSWDLILALLIIFELCMFIFLPLMIMLLLKPVAENVVNEYQTDFTMLVG